jgi:DNA-binding winged helix-turn-helix (wHTH) protein
MIASGNEVRFGRFRFDLERRELSRDEQPLHVGGRALDILHALASAQAMSSARTSS